LFASCCISITNNDTNIQQSTQQYFLFIYTICFDHNGSSSGVFSYTLFTIELQRQIYTIVNNVQLKTTENTWRWPTVVETYSLNK
jgi:hypothetical protein